MTRVSRHLDAEQITGYVEINPEDSVNLNIKEGDSVVLSSRRGRMEAPARLSGAVKPGVFFLPIHYDESPANMLTNSVFDPIAKIPEFKARAVKAEKLIEL